MLPVTLGALLLTAPMAGGDDVEKLPLPRPTESPAPVLLPAIPLAYPRVSAYEHWQNYGVDRFGRFRPLVLDTPSGAYYRYNGAPYPYTMNHPRSVVTYGP